MRSSYKATLWTFIGKFGSLFTSFVIGIILARLLSPSDYGLVGISSIFITLSNVFMDLGFANALIRKLDRTEEDLSTAFFFNIIMAASIYAVLFVASPFVAYYFDSEILCPLLRVSSLTLLLKSLIIVPNAILTSKLKMKQQTLISLGSGIPAGIASICMAYIGWGVYALALQSVISILLSGIFMWNIVKWHPILVFSKSSALYFWNFGSKLLGANLIGTLVGNLNSFIIGKYIGKAELGYFSKSVSLGGMPFGIFTGVIGKVGLPILSAYQNDKLLLLEKYRYVSKLILSSSLLIIGILFVVAKPLIIFLWTDKWEPSAFLMQILLISYIFSPACSLNLVLLQILNRTDITLKMEFIKKPLFVLILLFSARYGLIALVIGQTIATVLATTVNMYASKALISYSYRQQFYDILKYLIPAIIACIIPCYIIYNYDFNNIVKIIIGIILVPCIYILLFQIMKDDIYIELRDLCINKIKTIICK